MKEARRKKAIEGKREGNRERPQKDREESDEGNVGCHSVFLVYTVTD